MLTESHEEVGVEVETFPISRNAPTARKGSVSVYVCVLTERRRVFGHHVVVVAPRLVLVCARLIPFGHTRLGVHALIKRKYKGYRLTYHVGKLAAWFVPRLTSFEQFEHFIAVVVEVNVGRNAPIATTKDVGTQLEVDTVVQVTPNIFVTSGITFITGRHTRCVGQRHFEEHVARYTVVILHVQVQPT